MNSSDIVEKAVELGFDGCGISKADFLKADAEKMEQWLASGFEGEMSYLQRNKEKRYDPRLLLEGTKSVVTVLLNYYPERVIPEENNYKIAKYAYGSDYHKVVKDKLKRLHFFIEEKIGEKMESRAFTDSAPFLDRAWAVRSGLGFIGKNTSLIVPKAGSFFFIGHLLLPIELESTGKVIVNHCGKCTKCLDACPTKALKAPFTVDATKCISYNTIEYKDEFPVNIDKSAFQDWIYGCDICQDVCPYNKFAKPTSEPLFRPHPKLFEMRKKDWNNLNEQAFNELFKGSAVERAGFKGLKRNIG